MAKSKTNYLPFRPGDLGPSIDSAARISGQSRSEIVRRALEMYLHLEPSERLAILMGATENYLGLIRAGRNSDVISEERYQQLLKAVVAAEREIQEKLDVNFADIYPGEESLQEFRKKEQAFIEKRMRMCESKEWVEGSPKQRRAMEERFEAENQRPEPPKHIAEWQSLLDRSFRFPDLQAATGYFRSKSDFDRAKSYRKQAQPLPFPNS